MGGEFMKVIYLDNEIIGVLGEKQTLKEFLKIEFERQDRLVEMGYQNLHPCWAEHYESILLDFEEIPSYYIELNIDWYADKRDFTIRE